MDKVTKIHWPLSKLRPGMFIRVQMKDGTEKIATSTMVHVGDSSEMFIYDRETRKAIDKTAIDSWVPEDRL